MARLPADPADPAVPAAQPGTGLADADPATEADEGLRARKKRETRHALHRAAIELVAAGEPHDVTVEAIAARAGVSQRTFFNYFQTKEAAITGTDPELPVRLAAWLAERPAEESTVAAVRAVMLRRVGEIVQDADLWRLRREVWRRDPVLAASLLGANALADRALAEAACTRADVDVRDDLRPAAEAYAALGAVRAAMWQHMECGLQGALEDRVDEALAAAGLLATT